MPRIKEISMPDGFVAKFDTPVSIKDGQLMTGRYVKSKMRDATSILLTKGFLAMEKERDKYLALAKYVAMTY